MRFWDSSALIPLFVEEPTSTSVAALLRDDDAVVVGWTTEVECTSAITRLERAGRIDPSRADALYTELGRLAASWMVMQPSDAVRRAAIRLLRVHDLRAADALQLASAVTAAEGHPHSLGFVSLDDRLNAAARREGFALVVPDGH